MQNETEKYVSLKKVLAEVDKAKLMLLAQSLTEEVINYERASDILSGLFDNLYNASEQMPVPDIDLGEYTQAESECKGCSGPCGRCEDTSHMNKSYLAYCRQLQKCDSFKMFGSFKGNSSDIRNAWENGMPADVYSFTLIPW